MAQGQPIIWRALNAFRKTVCALPHEKAVALGGVLGGLVGRFSKKKAGEATKRCAKILGVSEERAREIVIGSYANFGRSAAEFARMPIVAERINDYVTSSGHEYIIDSVRSGRGAILATAHIGNWEYGACWVSRHLGLPVNSLGADQRDPHITEMIKELRAIGGCKALGKSTDLRAMMKALQNGEIIAVPVDQDSKEHGVLSPFLGYPASSPSGPARLAAKTGCDVITCACVRRPDGVTFEMMFNPPLKGRDGGAFGKDIQSSVDDLNEQVSEIIRKYPDQWMWMYPRWESVERGVFGDIGN